MKFKVKGLVFVGFAAAILSANAALADPDNTVTSKSYVDNKFQTIANIETEYTAANKNSTTEYPAMSALTQALTENGGVVNDSTVSVTQNGASIGSFSTNQAAGSTLAIAGADWNAASGTAGFIANKPTVDTTFDATSDNAATSAAIASYVTNQIQDTSNVGNGTISVTQNGVSAGSFTTNQNSAGSITIAAPDWNAASGTAGFIANKPTVDTTFDATSGNAATSQAIATYVTNQIQDGSNVGTGTLTVTQNGVTAGTFGANQNTAGSIAIVAPDWTAASGTAGFIANKPTVDTTFDATSNNAATSAAIAGYIDSLPAADIPAMPTQQDDPNGYCDASHPCALVTDETSGQPVWKRIAQAGDQ